MILSISLMYTWILFFARSIIWIVFMFVCSSIVVLYNVLPTTLSATIEKPIIRMKLSSNLNLMLLLTNHPIRIIHLFSRTHLCCLTLSYYNDENCERAYMLSRKLSLPIIFVLL